MDTIKWNKGAVKMIAHRGVSGLERENTAAAFVAAGNRSYFGIETDLHITADGQFLLIHDDNTLRVSGENKAVETTGYNALRSILLFDKDGKTKRGDLVLPNLEEYLTICRRYQKTAVLELKRPIPAASIERIVELVNRLGYLQHTIVISFHLQNLVALKERYPAMGAQFLVDRIPNTDGLIDTLKQYGLNLDANYKWMTRELVSKLHGAGIEVNVWTVDDPAQAEALRQMGVDYITTNILE